MTDLKKLIELRENYDDDTATDFVTMCFEFNFLALLTHIEKLEVALREFKDCWETSDGGASGMENLYHAYKQAKAALEDE